MKLGAGLRIIPLRGPGREVHAGASNLGNYRDPVTESEPGDARHYRLPERSVWLSLNLKLGEDAYRKTRCLGHHKPA